VAKVKGKRERCAPAALSSTILTKMEETSAANLGVSVQDVITVPANEKMSSQH